MYITGNVDICCDEESKGIQHALKNLKRDIEKTLVKMEEEIGWTLVLYEDKQLASEMFVIACKEQEVKILAADALGFIYGIYFLSKEFLGIQEFWFWNNQGITKKKKIEIPNGYYYASNPYPVRYRGWFLNDEVLLAAWDIHGDKKIPWEMALEALLRCGGNTVIPGTYKNADKYFALAHDMGLYIAQHHAQPLGAKMFHQVYPEKEASFAKYPELYRKLWMDEILTHGKENVIWSLGFRGQGDCPFWENDPQYATAEARGKVLEEIIREQYRLISEINPQAVCCTNLYGEAMELYYEGYFKIPKDVIKLWSDNGYGKMVSRRQDDYNPRVDAMPKKDGERNGIYYHVSFYDLQASNHLTMLPVAPNLICEELQQVLKNDGNEMWIINCSNVKPHVFYLALISEIWRGEFKNLNYFKKSFIKKYYGVNDIEIAKLYDAYSKAALCYGKYEDEKAGEEYYNHVIRMLISSYMKEKGNSPAEHLNWTVKANTFWGQIKKFAVLYEQAYGSYKELYEKGKVIWAYLPEKAKVQFEDSLLLHIKIYYYCSKGALDVCKAFKYLENEDYEHAFYFAGVAKKSYEKANAVMRDTEHGKWKNFYENDCLTDIKQTAYVLEGFLFFIRNLGDGPHFYDWHRRYLYAEEDRKITLIMNMENHLTNEDLFVRMEKEMEDI